MVLVPHTEDYGSAYEYFIIPNIESSALHGGQQQTDEEGLLVRKQRLDPCCLAGLVGEQRSHRLQLSGCSHARHSKGNTRTPFIVTAWVTGASAMAC